MNCSNEKMSEKETEAQSQKPRISKQAIWAAILSIFGIILSFPNLFCIGGVLALTGLVLGIVALVKIKKSYGMLTGRGWAILGIVTCLVFIIALSVKIAIFNLSIYSAAMKGNLAKVESILAEKPEQVNARDEYGKTPLHFAARKGQKEVVEFLIANGADVNVKDKFSRTPLFLAIKQGHKDTAELLRGYGGTE